MLRSLDHTPLIAQDEPPAFSTIRSGTTRPAGQELVIVCDHASNRVPASLGNLGLSERHLLDHIAWDIGAKAVALKLLEWLGGRGVLGGYSRLVVDLNRALTDSSAFTPLSDGVLVPGNIGLDAAAKAARAETFYWPYHHAVERALDEATTPATASSASPGAMPSEAAQARAVPGGAPEAVQARAVPGGEQGAAEAQATRGAVSGAAPAQATRGAVSGAGEAQATPVMIAVHSFTPRLHGIERPWHVGVLWDKDPRLPLRLLAALRAHPDIVAGDNEPYSGRHPADFTIDHHAEPRGIAHLSLEIRQDLIRDESGQLRWAERIAEVLEKVLKDDALYRPAEAVGLGPDETGAGRRLAPDTRRAPVTGSTAKPGGEHAVGAESDTGTGG